MQRLRVRFSRGDEIKVHFAPGPDALLGACTATSQVPLAYSEGFTPHPRISLAVPLAIGVD